MYRTTFSEAGISYYYRLLGPTASTPSLSDDGEFPLDSVPDITNKFSYAIYYLHCRCRAPVNQPLSNRLSSDRHLGTMMLTSDDLDKQAAHVCIIDPRTALPHTCLANCTAACTILLLVLVPQNAKQTTYMGKISRRSNVQCTRAIYSAGLGGLVILQADTHRYLCSFPTCTRP